MSYGKIHTSFWTDDKMIGLSTEAKLLALYFLSGPHRNSIGCMRVPAGYIQGDLGWSFEGVYEALRELVEAGFITREDDTGWTVINNLLKYDPVKGDKAAIGAAKIASSVPRNSDVYAALYQRLGPILEAELKARSDVLGYPMQAPSVGDDKGVPSPYLTLPNQTNTPAEPKGVVDVSKFDEWYSAYPLHKGRGQALRAYRSALKKTDHETLVNAARRYASDPARKPEFTKHPSTWLNAEAWADEPAKAANPPQEARSQDDRLRALATQATRAHAEKKEFLRVRDMSALRILLERSEITAEVAEFNGYRGAVVQTVHKAQRETSDTAA